ncbi:MAG: hypothetical protein AAF488_15915 [Planctomycetota bacterium]
MHRRSKQIFLTVAALDPRDRTALALLLARGDPEVEAEVTSLLRTAERERDSVASRLRADPAL